MSDELNGELRDEYQFNYSQSQPNRFATGIVDGGRLVVLDPDVAAAFTGPESVNAVLRALLQTMPDRGGSPSSGDG